MGIAGKRRKDPPPLCHGIASWLRDGVYDVSVYTVDGRPVASNKITPLDVLVTEQARSRT